MEAVLSEVRQVLTTTSSRWLELTRTLSPELLRLRPAPQEWSAVECLQHLIDTERDVFPLRLRALLIGQDFPAFDPDRPANEPDTARPPAALADEFHHLRTVSLAELAPITSADLDRKARHAELGLVTLGEMIHEWAAHDLMHTVQAERALMQPFIRGCGPWRRYFLDHIAK